MAQDEDQYDARRELVQLLLEKVANDPYPSTTQMDMIEEMLAPEDVQSYAEILMDKIRADKFPSVSLMSRVQGLA